MTDEEYIFRQTVKERKSAGNGAKHKKRGGGRYVRLPSDRLSKKEREALNGEVKTYKKKDFYTWEEFKALPSDLQVAWCNSLINRCGCGLSTIGEEVFSKSHSAMHYYFENKGELKYINKGATEKKQLKIAREKLAAAFENWKNTQITMSDENLPQDDPAPAALKESPVEIESLHETTASEREETVAPAPQIAVKQSEPTAVCFDPANIAALIAALAGSGAKLTIEVTL